MQATATAHNFEAHGKSDPAPVEGAEQVILVGGVPVPLEMAGQAVARCIRAIQIVDGLLNQGFASEDDLVALRAGLTGEDKMTEGTKDAPVEL
jgi:hypothetical protein